MTEFFDAPDGTLMFRSPTSSGEYVGKATSSNIARHPLIYAEYLNAKALRAVAAELVEVADEIAPAAEPPV